MIKPVESLLGLVTYFVDPDLSIVDGPRELHAFTGEYVVFDNTYYLLPYVNLSESVNFDFEVRFTRKE